MDALNSLEARKLTPAQNMARLEQAVAEADQRIRIRRNVSGRVSIALGFIVAVPLSTYMLFNLFAPHGVMQNYKTSAGAYMYWS